MGFHFWAFSDINSLRFHFAEILLESFVERITSIALSLGN
jgi:hypothetical protein